MVVSKDPASTIGSVIEAAMEDMGMSSFCCFWVVDDSPESGVSGLSCRFDFVAEFLALL